MGGMIRGSEVIPYRNDSYFEEIFENLSQTSEKLAVKDYDLKKKKKNTILILLQNINLLIVFLSLSQDNDKIKNNVKL